jgi:hypothetical protein
VAEAGRVETCWGGRSATTKKKKKERKNKKRNANEVFIFFMKWADSLKPPLFKKEDKTELRFYVVQKFFFMIYFCYG